MSDGQIINDAFDGYGKAPRMLLREAKLSSHAKVLWVILEDMSSPDSPQPFPGQARLAEWMGVSQSTVRRALGELRCEGWLQWRQRGVNKTNIYRMTRPNTSKQAEHRICTVKNAACEQSRTPPVNTKAKPEEAEPEEAPPPPPTRNPRPARNKGRGGIEDLKQEALDAGWTTSEWDRLLSSIARDGTIRSPKAFIRHRIANDDKPIVVEMF